MGLRARRVQGSGPNIAQEPYWQVLLARGWPWRDAASERPFLPRGCREAAVRQDQSEGPWKSASEQIDWTTRRLGLGEETWPGLGLVLQG